MYKFPNSVTGTSSGIVCIAQTGLIIPISEIKVYMVFYSPKQS